MGRHAPCSVIAESDRYWTAPKGSQTGCNLKTLLLFAAPIIFKSLLFLQSTIAKKIKIFI
jgi:hypothetical protein